jgi:diguanylate cyclase (GGDEF)-like protein
MLADAGYRDVVTADTAQEAFDTLGLDRPPPSRKAVDLILLDVGLPQLDGLSACRRITAAKHGTVPVIMVTAHEEETVLEAAFAAGATDFVKKPTRQRELLARVAAALRLKRARERDAVSAQALAQRAACLEATGENLGRLSTEDALTGIANRRKLDSFLAVEWRRALREGSQIALVMVDVDHFHSYNERHGHVQGDECLKRLAAAFAGIVRRPSDLLARYGGEEFVMVLPHTDVAGARLLAERLRTDVEALHLLHGALGGPDLVTVSEGVAARRPRPELPPESLIVAADQALYRAKATGRNRVCLAPEATDA